MKERISREENKALLPSLLPFFLLYPPTISSTHKMTNRIETNTDEQLIHQSHIQVTTHLSEVSIALKWFEQFHRPPLTHRLWQQANIALMEGLTNAIRHAHHDLPRPTPIDLNANLFSHGIQISIRDYGAPFDLEELLNSLSQPLADPIERRSHWGGVLLRKLRDKHDWTICYACPISGTGDRNCLIISHTILPN
jgi:serine/threonine-protein kinase RsbW